MNTKILLFYKYFDIEDPKQVRDWQYTLCQDLGLRGRILIAHEGINGTLGGSAENIEQYKKVMQAHPFFTDIDFKENEGGIEYFPRLQVTVKKTIVNFGIDSKEIRAKNTGKHLTPEQVHALLSNKPDDLVILDARNYVESKIGHFKDAILPDIARFRDLPDYINNNLEQFKDKQVLMYCTGGIRCEPASAYLKSKNVTSDVYQIAGGIHRYIEQYPNGFFRGKNYVFDGRIAVAANEDIVGTCDICSVPCDEYTNCLHAQCNKHFICCQSCLVTLQNTCSPTCKELVYTKDAPKRPEFKKIHKSSCTIE